MVQISAVIITFNEERNIGRCLTSLVDIADEIVVVDSYSTDNTEEIAKKFKIRFIQHPFEGHIQQKNFALDQCSYPHVLSLDADEVLSDRLRQSILKVKENWVHDGYYFNRLTNYCGKWIYHCNWYPDRKLRLWNREKGRWGGENPHDKVIMDSGADIHYIHGDLLHYSYYSIGQHVEQIQKFTSIMAAGKYRDKKYPAIPVLLFKPIWKFFRGYFLKLGFLDGYYGLVICTMSAYATFLKYVKARELFITSSDK